MWEVARMKREREGTEQRPGLGDEARYERVAIARIAEALDAQFAARLGRQRVASAVAEAQAHFHDAPLREYVPVMVERQARAELTATRRADGSERGG
jgi:hypothetical protein